MYYHQYYDYHYYQNYQIIKLNKKKIDNDFEFLRGENKDLFPIFCLRSYVEFWELGPSPSGVIGE